jgi:hypothetical protein
MTTRALTNSSSSQIAFRYRPTDSATGVSRETAKRLAAQLLPQYEADDGALSAAQLEQIKQQAPQGTKRSVRSSLFELNSNDKLTA